MGHPTEPAAGRDRKPAGGSGPASGAQRREPVGSGDPIVRAEHALALQRLPWIHRDPHRCAEDFVFDRLLVVQAQLVAYGEPVQAAG